MKTVSKLVEARAVLVTNHMTATMLAALAQYPPHSPVPKYISSVLSLSAIVIVKLSFGICYKIPLFNGGQLNPGIL